jgi:hypothetical protein
MFYNNKSNKYQYLNIRCGLVQTGTPFGYWIITGAVELGFRSRLYVWKAKT